MLKNWIEVELGDVLLLSSEKHKPEIIENLFYIGLEHIEKDTGRLTIDVAESNINTIKNKFYTNQILYGKLRPYLNKVYLATQSGVCSTDILVFNVSEATDSKYALHFILSRQFVNDMSANTSGVNLPRVSTKYINSYKFPLAPLPEQRAIASKIEQLFSELDNGIANLKTAKSKLEIYRQAILKQAFEGNLTKDWRKKQPKNHGNHVNQKNHSADNLPETWKWVKLSEVANHITDGDHQAPPKASEGIPFITISNIDKSTNRIDFSNTFYVEKEYYFNLKENRKPQKGDILYTVTGSFGIPVLIDFIKDFCFQRHIGLIRPLESINQKWLYWLLQTRLVYGQASEKATGTAQKTVALSILRNITIPFCPIEEQTQIVQEIETRLSVCDKLNEAIEQSLEKAQALRQSILKKAFEGKLLSQDELQTCRQQPDWEPAAKLLERVKKDIKTKR